MLKFRILGGMGEKGRVGFELLTSKGRIVLDYGVKRKLSGRVDDVYPLPPLGFVDFLFLSHSHLDHVGAVPLLDFSCIVCSEPTFELLKHQLRSWMKVAGDLLLKRKDYETFLESAIVFRRYPERMSVKIGRSGHTLGSQWFFFEEASFLYTGDIVLDSPLYHLDPLPRAEILLVDTAYGVEKLKGREELLNILSSRSRRYILPLPAIGRSQEILVELLRERVTPVFVDERILKGFEYLKRYRGWTDVNIDLAQLNTKLQENIPYGVYLTTDGMMTSGTSVTLYEMLKDDEETIFVITGHVEEGTLGWKLLKEGRAISFTWKVHPDVEDLLRIIDTVKPNIVIPFHSEKKDLEKLKAFFEREGFRTLIPERGELIDMEGIS